MHVLLRLPDESPLTVTISFDTQGRLFGTHFRRCGGMLQCAGNFYRWQTPTELLHDPLMQNGIRESLMPHVTTMADDLTIRRMAVGLNISYPAMVGWESTDDMAKYAPENLERFEPNMSSQGLRLKTDLKHIKAPQTNLVTLRGTLSFPSIRGPTFQIGTIYPGVYIGALQGDITAREGRIFFDWNHPGM